MRKITCFFISLFVFVTTLLGCTNSKELNSLNDSNFKYHTDNLTIVDNIQNTMDIQRRMYTGLNMNL